MKKINPYTTRTEARKSLDNGGRFYNLMTKSDDGIITGAELKKVAGLYGNKQRMILFLELAISKLDDNAKMSIVNTLEEDLKKAYRTYRPEVMVPSKLKKEGVLAKNIIVEGIPRLIKHKTEFKGFIMVPVMVNNVTTFSMVPIIDAYDVYEIQEVGTETTVHMAHAKSKKKLPEKSIKIGGVLKELKSKKEDEVADKSFLEAIYYLD